MSTGSKINWYQTQIKLIVHRLQELKDVTGGLGEDDLRDLIDSLINDISGE